MATLVYRGVRLDVIRTVDYVTEPAMDPSGIDKKCTKITITVEGIFSEYGHGSGKPPGFGIVGVPGFPTFGARGDNLGVSLYNLRDHLMAPRGILEYYVMRDLVFEAPQRTAGGSRFPCDVMGGPFPKSFRILGGVTGDRAAFVQYSIECYVNNCDQFLLSNRWKLSDHVDENHFASLTIQGIATFRKDFLEHTGLVADDWRKWLVYPIEPRMKRVGVNVNVDELGSEVQYVVQDRETNYGTGTNSLISKVNCHVHSSIEYPIKSVQDMARHAGTIAERYASAIDMAMRLNFAGSAMMGVSAQAAVMASIFPTVSVRGNAQVYGVPGVSRLYLMRVAHALVHDRCRGFNVAKRGVQVGTRITVDWSSDAPPFVEFEAEFFVSPIYAIRAFFNEPEGLFNWDERIGGEPVMALGWDKDTPRAVLPGGDNTRAQNLGRLVAQVLESGVCQPVGIPPLSGAGGHSVTPLNVDVP